MANNDVLIRSIEEAKSGDITMNQAYKKSKDSGAFLGSFKEFIEAAKGEGLIDQVGDIFNTALGRPTSSNTEYYEQDSKGVSKHPNLGRNIAIAVGVIALGYGIYYISQNKKG